MAAQLRNVASVVVPQAVIEGAGVRLKRSIGTGTLNYVDPFLLLDHFGSDDPRDYLAGFPMHPHRGIETVTYMLAGEVTHKDSIGNSGTIGPGDVQWMTSGRGIMHEEMPRPREGRMEGFQLWVNMPAKLKMTQPRYQEIAAGQIPEVRREDGTIIRVIAGTVDGVCGPVVDIMANPTYLDVFVPANHTASLAIERGQDAFVYLFEGQAVLATQAVPNPRLVVLEDGDYVDVRTENEPARCLFVSGMPLHEPIARYGPFVMNTQGEIQQALSDLRNGTFIQP